MADKAANFKYVFGPVRSGRLGLSLGLDLLGGRVCTFDCLYCEAGPTVLKTVERRPYVTAEEAYAELLAWRKLDLGTPDYVTLGGLGEPTLNSELAEIVTACRQVFPSVPVAVLTNSSLLGDPVVAYGLGRTSVVLPSLDTLVPAEYTRLNRPHQSLDVESLLRGLFVWRGLYDGVVRLEILLCAGINDSEENLALLRDNILELRPEHVDIVTVSRPGAFPEARPVSPEVLARWREALGADAEHAATASPEIKAGPGHCDRSAATPQTGHAPEPEAVLRSIRRRPQTVTQLAQALGAPEDWVLRTLEEYMDARRVEPADDAGGEIFYAVKRPDKSL